jgi:hypothetical protein
MFAVMMPDAISSFQYVENQRIPTGPDFAPRRTNPRRASRFRSNFNPSCRQTRCRDLGIWSSFFARLDRLERINRPAKIYVVGSDEQDCRQRLSVASGAVDQNAKIILIAAGVPRAE